MSTCINLHILCSELNNAVAEPAQGSFFLHTDRPSYIRNIAFVQIWQGRFEADQEDILYIVNAEALPDSPDQFPASCPLLIMGLPERKWLDCSLSFVYADVNMNRENTINLVLGIFQRYSRWQNSLEDIINREQPLRRAGICSLPFLGNPIFVQASGFQTLFHVWPSPGEKPSDQVRRYLREDIMREEMDTETIVHLTQDAGYQQLRHSQEPYIMHMDGVDYSSLVCPLRVRDQTAGYICVDLVYRDADPADFGRITILAACLEKAFHLQKSRAFDSHSELPQIMEMLLSHILVPEEKITALLQYYGWRVEDTYLCLFLKPNVLQVSAQLSGALAAGLSGLLGTEFYSVRDNGIAFVLNLTQLHHAPDPTSQDLKVLLRDNDLTGGISYPFTDFKDLYYYYQQAIAAWRLGRKQHPTQWFFNFKDYELIYLISQCKKNQTSRSLIPEGLRILIEQDRKNETEYTKLLEVFLNSDRSVTKTIRKMYMHRNTALQRLEHIRRVTGYDLEDENLRLLLLIVFRCMRK